MDDPPEVVPDEVLAAIDEMTWWMYDNTCIGMGAYRQFDYTMIGNLGPDLSPRLGDCYMLAVQAFTGWEKMLNHMPPIQRDYIKPQIPAPHTLVHGWWKHPREPKGIQHAWVILDNGQVWEPITGLICDANLFYQFGNCRDFQRYNETEARVMMLRHQHYGPWA